MVFAHRLHSSEPPESSPTTNPAESDGTSSEHSEAAPSSNHGHGDSPKSQPVSPDVLKLFQERCIAVIGEMMAAALISLLVLGIVPVSEEQLV